MKSSKEVRRARDEYAAGFNYDIAAMCADIRRRQWLHNHDIVAKRLLFSENQTEPSEQITEARVD